ncbi:hypothetical protein TRAPUB_12219 [Trametes pubescens]|uniref:Uncharacterized protein n=1 Tax=Trametes pubescens TaxID=154538 RepID=A0A1M2VUQ8_TRAPU|nr:hypothetical protein TRAPUB_12219 [Trametes pubescens]
MPDSSSPDYSSSPLAALAKKTKSTRQIIQSDAEDGHDDEVPVQLSPRSRLKPQKDSAWRNGKVTEILTEDEDVPGDISTVPASPKPQKRRGKGKPKVTEPLTDNEVLETAKSSANDKKTRAKRVEWNTHFVPAQAYLTSRFREWNYAPKKAATAVVKDAAQYVVKHWDFTGYPAEDVRNAVRNWFRNHKKRFDEAGEPIATNRRAKKTHPLLARMRSRAPAASALWAKANPKDVDDELEDSDDIGERQKVVARLFSSLPMEEKDIWRWQAQEAKEERTSNPDQCFINQTDIADVLADVMQELNGYGSEQIGAAVFHLQFAVRDIDGKIESKEFTCGHMVDELPFMEFEGGTPQSESDRWARFIDLSLPSNPQRRDTRLKYSTAGRPLLPQWNDDWNKTQAADVLKTFLNASWSYAHAGKQLQPLDFTAINKEPGRYLPTLWQDLHLECPTDLKMAGLVRLHERIYDAQDGEQAFTFLLGHDTTPESATRDPPRTPAKVQRVTTFISPARISRTATPAKGTRGLDRDTEGLPSRLLLPTIPEARAETDHATTESVKHVEGASVSAQQSESVSVSVAAEGEQDEDAAMSMAAGVDKDVNTSMAMSVGPNDLSAPVPTSAEQDVGVSASVAAEDKDGGDNLSMASADEEDNGESAYAGVEVEEESSKVARTRPVKRKSGSQGTRATTTKRTRLSGTATKEEKASRNTCGTFKLAPDGDATYHYNVPVYANDSLASGKHTFTMVVGHPGGQSSIALLDYMIFTAPAPASSHSGTLSSILTPISTYTTSVSTLTSASSVSSVLSSIISSATSALASGASSAASGLSSSSSSASPSSNAASGMFKSTIGAGYGGVVGVGVVLAGVIFGAGLAFARDHAIKYPYVWNIRTRRSSGSGPKDPTHKRPQSDMTISLAGLSGAVTVAATASGPSLLFNTEAITITDEWGSPLVVSTSTPTVSSTPTLSPSSSSSSSPGPGPRAPPTALAASLSVILGVAVVAMTAALCWIRRRRRARRERVSLASGPTQPAHQTRRTSPDAATVTISVRARVGSDVSTIVGVGGSDGKEDQGDAPTGGVSRSSSTTARSAGSDTDRASLRAPSLSERLYAFFSGASTGSLSSGGDAPPVYEPHVLPEYRAVP